MIKSYEKYKDSGVEWIGGIPEHWDMVKFRYRFELTKGLTITKSTLSDEGIPCVNYGEIHSKYGFELNQEIPSLKCVSEEYLETNDGSLLSRGDFVFADTSEDIKGAGNFTHLNSDTPTFAGYHTIIARLIDDSNYRYIAYFIDSTIFRTQIQNLVKGVKVYSITNKILKDTILFSPLKEEQTQIAKYLDYNTSLIDSIIAQKEQLIEKLKEQRQAMINEAVTKGLNSNAPLKDSGIEWLGYIPEHWEVVKLKFLGDSITGITYSPNDVTENGTLVLRSSNIQKGRLALQDKVYVNKSIADKYLTRSGDILLCSRNGSRKLIGKNIMLDERVENETWGAFMTVYRSDYNDFMYFFFNSDIFSALSSLFLSSTINQLTIGVLNNMQIAFPKKESERKKIIDYLTTKTEEMNQVIRLNNEQIKKLKEYRQSIISEAVTGKIDVRDWKPKTA